MRVPLGYESDPHLWLMSGFLVVAVLLAAVALFVAQGFDSPFGAGSPPPPAGAKPIP